MDENFLMGAGKKKNILPCISCHRFVFTEIVNLGEE